MTFVLEGPWAFLFFISYLALLCICVSGMQQYEEVCSHRPGQACAHKSGQRSDVRKTGPKKRK